MRQPRFQVYEDKGGEWRWRLLAANGRTIADSGEAYTRRPDAERAVETVTAIAGRIETARIVARIKARA